MKRPGFKAAVQWIAVNDDAETFDLEMIRGYTSVCLVADLFEVPQQKVAEEVLAWRKTAYPAVAAALADMQSKES